MIVSLTWLDTPSDNTHHIGGALHLFIVEDVEFHITGKEDSEVWSNNEWREAEVPVHDCSLSNRMYLE